MKTLCNSCKVEIETLCMDYPLGYDCQSCYDNAYYNAKERLEIGLPSDTLLKILRTEQNKVVKIYVAT